MKADFGWDDTERKESNRKEKGKGKKRWERTMGRNGKDKGRAVAHTDAEKIWGTCFRGRFPYVFVNFGLPGGPPTYLFSKEKGKWNWNGEK